MKENNRIWLIPYMGDASYVGAAILRGYGIDAEVMPTNTEKGNELAENHIYTEVCHPLKIVTGDVLNFLYSHSVGTSKKETNEKYLLMLPTTHGPCRFGKYTECLRSFMDLEGFTDVPIISPSTRDNYNLPINLSKKEKKNILKSFVKGTTSSDLLEDITRRFSPYEQDNGKVAELKKMRLKKLEEIMENREDTNKLISWGEETVESFKKIKLSTNERFPLVLYIGEIYMRQHDPSTSFVINKLENQKLEIIRSPIIEWFNYIVQRNHRDAIKDSVLGFKYLKPMRLWEGLIKFTKLSIARKYVEHIEETLSEPFKEVLHGRHVLPEPIDLIKALEKEKEFTGDIGGESPLSVGAVYYFMNGFIKSDNLSINGIFHVGPFTCMHEVSASAKIDGMIKQLRKEDSEILVPIVHAFFGDSPNPNLDAEIAVFKEQCYQKRDMQK